MVLARTGHYGRWKIGWYVQDMPEIDGALIREIGTDELCNYGNESFVPIVNMYEITLWEGAKREFYVKVRKAFARGNKYSYRFGGLKFDNGKEAIITIREVFGGLGGRSLPFDVRMKWNQKTTIKKILEAMIDGGYGSRSFDPICGEEKVKENKNTTDHTTG